MVHPLWVIRWVIQAVVGTIFCREGTKFGLVVPEPRAVYRTLPSYRTYLYIGHTPMGTWVCYRTKLARRARKGYRTTIDHTMLSDVRYVIGLCCGMDLAALSDEKEFLRFRLASARFVSYNVGVARRGK